MHLLLEQRMLLDVMMPLGGHIIMEGRGLQNRRFAATGILVDLLAASRKFLRMN